MPRGPHIGERVCSSGANSGEHCRLEVYDNDHVACSTLGTCHRWLAYNLDLNTAAIGGDSGGPVYHTVESNTDRVNARGVIKSGGVLTGPCGDHRWDTSQCYSDVLFIGINDLLDYWTVSIETN